MHRLAVMCLLLSGVATAQEHNAEVLFTQSMDLLVAGDYQNARDGFFKAWKELARTRGEDNSLTLEARIFYGQVLSMTGRAEEAMTVLGPVSSGETEMAMVARASFALALRQSGQIQRAIVILRELVRNFPPDSKGNLAHLGRMYSELAVCYAFTGRYKEGEDSAKQALRMLEAAGNPVPAHRAAVDTILGQLYLLSGRDALAYQTLIRAQEEAKPYWRSTHPELGILEGALGLLAYRAHQYEEAEKRTRNSLAAARQLFGPEHPEAAFLSRQLATVLKKQHKKAEARALEADASRILGQRRVEARVSAWSWREVK